MYLSAIGLGIILSLVLIGPVFFLLIETSIVKGRRAAIALDIGVILADLFCIVVIYLAIKDISEYFLTHPKLKYTLWRIAGVIVFVYGAIMYFTKPKMHLDNNPISGNNYIKIMTKGFFINLLNVGLVFFWFGVVNYIVSDYSEDFWLFTGIVLTTFFVVDLLKIFLAQKLQKKFTDEKVYQMRKIVGIALAVFGLFFILKSYGVMDSIDKKLQNKLPIQESTL